MSRIVLLILTLAFCTTALAQSQAIVFPATTNGWPKKQLQQARSQCQNLLKNLDIKVEPLPPIGKPGSCGTAAPVRVTSIADVAIEPPADLNCAMAASLYHWVAWAAKPAAEQHLKKQLVTINNASAYVCRRRNNQARGKLSEHAFANAFDISTLQFSDDSAISIKGDWSGKKGVHLSGKPKADFLRRLRAFACIRFSTVLGPGSDAHHGDHFHIDLAPRKSGFRVCR